MDILDPATGAVSNVIGGSYRFMELVTVPEPSALAILGLGLLFCRGLRR